MKKNLSKTLKLNRETVRNLDDAGLKTAAGGNSVLIRCGVTITCPGVCFSKGDDSCICQTK